MTHRPIDLLYSLPKCLEEREREKKKKTKKITQSLECNQFIRFIELSLKMEHFRIIYHCSDFVDYWWNFLLRLIRVHSLFANVCVVVRWSFVWDVKTVVVFSVIATVPIREQSDLAKSSTYDGKGSVSFVVLNILAILRLYQLFVLITQRNFDRFFSFKYAIEKEMFCFDEFNNFDNFVFQAERSMEYSCRPFWLFVK